MNNLQLFDDFYKLEEKFCNFFRHCKKVKALDHFSSVSPFDHRDFLSLIKKCLKDAFLDNKEADFLEHLITKYELNWREWAHKTPWLKRQMSKMMSESLQKSQMMFDYSKVAKPAINIPVNMISRKSYVAKRV